MFIDEAQIRGFLGEQGRFDFGGVIAFGDIGNLNVDVGVLSMKGLDDLGEELVFSRKPPQLKIDGALLSRGAGSGRLSTGSSRLSSGFGRLRMSVPVCGAVAGVAGVPVQAVKRKVKMISR